MKILTGLLVAAVLSVSAPAQAANPADAVFPRGLPWATSPGECAGTFRCVWNDREQGDNTGQSMILTRWAGGYVAKPIGHNRAARLQVAWCERPKVACGYGE